MVALLLPPHLLRQVVEDWMPNHPNRGFRPAICPLDDRIAHVFEVGLQMARIAGEKVLEQIRQEWQHADTALR